MGDQSPEFKLLGFLQRLRRSPRVAELSPIASFIKRSIPPELAIDASIPPVDDILAEAYARFKQPADGETSVASENLLKRILHAKLNDDMKDIDRSTQEVAEIEAKDPTAAVEYRDTLFLTLLKCKEFHHALDALDKGKLDIGNEEGEKWLAIVIENFSRIIRHELALAEAIEKGLPYKWVVPSGETTWDSRVQKPRYDAKGYRERTDMILIPLGKVLLEKFPAPRKFKTNELRCAHKTCAELIGVPIVEKQRGEKRQDEHDALREIYFFGLEKFFEKRVREAQSDKKSLVYTQETTQKGAYVIEREVIEDPLQKQDRIVSSRTRVYEGDKTNYKSDESKFIQEQIGITSIPEEVFVIAFRQKEAHIDRWMFPETVFFDGIRYWDIESLGKYFCDQLMEQALRRLLLI